MSFQDLESGRPLSGKRWRDSMHNGGGGGKDPTQAVVAGVFQINTAVSTFQRLVNTLGTPKDTPELRERLWVSSSSSSSSGFFILLVVAHLMIH